MPKYLLQVAYTSEAWASMVKNPQDRIEAVRPAIQSIGGDIECGYLAYGEYDLIAIADFPDNVASAAFSIDVASKGAVKELKTTPLLTMKEAVEAMEKASSVTYTPPR
jgi:uncharacterized protein with GYD domain